MYNDYLSIVTRGLLAALPAAASLDIPSIPRIFYATDTRATYFYNPASLAWELQTQQVATTFALLPTANLVSGSRAIVTDMTAAPVIGAAAAGAGAVRCPVNWDGAAWRVG